MATRAICGQGLIQDRLCSRGNTNQRREGFLWDKPAGPPGPPLRIRLGQSFHWKTICVKHFSSSESHDIISTPCISVELYFIHFALSYGHNGQCEIQGKIFFHTSEFLVEKGATCIVSMCLSVTCDAERPPMSGNMLGGPDLTKKSILLGFLD